MKLEGNPHKTKGIAKAEKKKKEPAVISSNWKQFLKEQKPTKNPNK